VPGGYTIDRLRDELALRIAAIPEFRAKLADSQLNLDYPGGSRTMRSTSIVICCASACRRREGDGNWPRFADTWRRLRWNATGRCGRCGWSRVFATPTRARAVCWRW